MTTATGGMTAQRHNHGKGQQGDRRHNNGDGRHDDGDWRHDNGDGPHDHGKGQKAAAVPPPPAYQPQHHCEHIYKSRQLGLF